MDREEIKRQLAIHGRHRIAAICGTHPDTPAAWASGRRTPLPIRADQMRTMLPPAPKVDTSPMSLAEARARIEALGGPGKATKKIGVCHGTLWQWWHRVAEPSLRVRVALRRSTPSVTGWREDEPDTSPMTPDEIRRIVVRLGGFGDTRLAIGCSKQALSSWLEGSHAPSPKYRAKLRSAYRSKCGSHLVDPQNS